MFFTLVVEKTRVETTGVTLLNSVVICTAQRVAGVYLLLHTERQVVILYSFFIIILCRNCIKLNNLVCAFIYINYTFFFRFASRSLHYVGYYGYLVLTANNGCIHVVLFFLL